MTAHYGTDATQLRQRLAALSSPAERTVGEFLLAAGPRAAAMSAREVAADTGTSDATVVRTARSMGFSGFREMRRGLAQVGEVRIDQALRATITGTPAPQDQLRSVVERHSESLLTMASAVSQPDFARAADLLASAPRVWWTGVGPSSHLADYGAFLCRRLGRPSGSFTHAGPDQADELLSLSKDEAVVALAYGRLHPHARVLLERAAEVGAKAILVTDVVSAPKATPVAVTLVAGRGAPGMFASHGTTIVLIEALVLSLAAAEPTRAQASLDRLNQLRRAITGRRTDVDA